MEIEKDILFRKKFSLPSDTMWTAICLALSGGYQDAYTYFIRDGVFSNGQTGNVVLLSANVLNGNWHLALRYLFPIIAFAFGVWLTAYIHAYFALKNKYSWRYIVICLEMLDLTVVGFLGKNFNVLAAVLVSVACAMQVQAFRNMRGLGYASTMCIGNLRGCMEAYSFYCHTHESAYRRQVHDYAVIIVAFACGAALGSFMASQFSYESIWFCIILLLFSMKDLEFMVQDEQHLQF